MRWSHLRATLWLRWRILVNRIRRASKLGNALVGLLLVVGSCVSAGSFVLALVLGLQHLPEAEPRHVMVVWGVLGLAFLFFWMIGLLTDLQRSDAMSFKHLLHLPVSLGWVFLYNYLSSYVSLSVALFLPAMLGLCLAQVIVQGPLMLLSVPLVLGFFGLITALTYQLRGWLARLMENKRRGRSVVAIITVVFVLLLQAPNLINLRNRDGDREERRRAQAEYVELRRAAEEEGPGQAAAEAELARYEEQREEEERALERHLSLGLAIVPLGWLPYGMRATFERRWLAGCLCALGMLLIGTWSLRRSFRATLAAIVGAGDSGRGVASPRTGPEVRGREAGGASATLLVERELPWVGEHGAGIALASLRSLMRAPEAKLLLMSPVIVLGLFGFMVASSSVRSRMHAFAPMMSLGAVMMGLLSVLQLIQNQFGLDRAGFRAYVLSPVPRARILLGKNLAIAPVGLGIGLIALVVLQLLVPADLAHLLGAVLQLCSAFLLLCMVGNLVSILAPMRLKDNALKAANPKFKTVVLQLLLVLLLPVTLAPLLIPAGVEYLLRGQAWARAVPLYLMLHALGLGVILLFYRWMLRRQGELLQDREQRILDVLTHD